jgi:hypothetical protein
MRAGDILVAARRWRVRLLTTGHLYSCHPVVVGGVRVVGGCLGGAGDGGGRFPDERTPVEATPLSATFCGAWFEFGSGFGIGFTLLLTQGSRRSSWRE